MKKILALAMCAVMLCSCGIGGDSSDSQRDRLVTLERASVIPVEVMGEDSSKAEKVNYKEQKALWISYIDLAPMLTGKSEEEFRSNFSAACENAAELGCNTLYVHVRPFGDAIYFSKLYPPSRYITGQAGKRGGFDPLEIMIETAHENGLSFHAWVNPLRCENEEAYSAYDNCYPLKQWYDMDNGYLQRVEGDSHLWLDPAYDEVRKLIADGVAELAENYDIDGIHYDDYFYPTTVESFDVECFSAQSEFDDLSLWRLDNINKMAAEIYNAVKSVDDDIVVGVSPQGNIENNYEYMYADVKKWCAEEGYIDYICPQIYFGYDNSVKPYLQTLADWKSLCTGNVDLIAGLGVYKLGAEDEFADDIGIIGRQISDAVEEGGFDGAALYAYNNIFTPTDDMIVRTNQELEFIRAALEDF